MGDILYSLLKLIVILVLVDVFEKVSSSVSQVPSCGCGVSPKTRRVIGGSNTRSDQFRWTVMIMEKFGPGSAPRDDDVYICGGAIIASSYVVTAAHCFGSTNNSNLWVYVGGNNLKSRIRTLIPVSRVKLHENYIAKSVENDIAIVTLKTPVQFSSNVHKACLPPTGMDLTGTNVTVAGWGAKEEAGPNQDILQYATVPVIPTARCQQLYANTVARIGQSNICAGFNDGSKDACQGDSGGPLVYDCQGRYTLVGVVSYGIGCGDKDFPGVYANVSYYYPWIVQNTPNGDLCQYVCYPPKTEIPVECGWPNKVNSVSKRVVGGSETKANEYPWMVSVYILIFLPNNPNGAFTFTCGGSLISKHWVLTSASCVRGIALSDIMFGLGDYNIMVFNADQSQVSGTDRIEYPVQNSNSRDNDLALGHLIEDITYTEYVRPICIAPSNYLSSFITSTCLTLLGWGRVSSTGPFSDRLKQVSLLTLNNTFCSYKYGYTFLTDRMICTNSTKSADACQGDKGGPLQMKDKAGQYFLLAVQSFIAGSTTAPRCGQGFPAINTRVQPFVDWILTTTGIQSTTPTNKLPPVALPANARC